MTSTNDLTDFVPYVGATDNLDLGLKSLSTAQVTATDAEFDSVVINPGGDGLTLSGGAVAHLVSADGNTVSTMQQENDGALYITTNGGTINTHLKDDNIYSNNGTAYAKMTDIVAASSQTPSDQSFIIV
jgi:hypothetical protein